jgi:predicted Fe-Mo cluster-binding NifX family protein
MKIAAITADGVSIHSHFGQAPYFTVLEIVDGHIISREQRPKPFHKWHYDHAVHHPEKRDAHSGSMAAVIDDCEVLLARGMGEPAFYALSAAGIEPILVSEKTIDEAVQAYLSGELQHHSERIHQH